MTDNEWQKILVGLRDIYLSCPSCYNTLPINEFIQNSQIVCNCGHSYSYPLELIIDSYNIPLFPGHKLYACHTNEIDDYNTITGEVIINKNNTGLWGIKNISGYSWNVAFPDGSNKNIDSGSIVPIAEDIAITFNNNTGKIRKNNNSTIR
jgi:hypothetical protein